MKVMARNFSAIVLILWLLSVLATTVTIEQLKTKFVLMQRTWTLIYLNLFISLPRVVVGSNLIRLIGSKHGQAAGGAITGWLSCA